MEQFIEIRLGVPNERPKCFFIPNISRIREIHKVDAETKSGKHIDVAFINVDGQDICTYEEYKDFISRLSRQDRVIEYDYATWYNFGESLTEDSERTLRLAMGNRGVSF